MYWPLVGWEGDIGNILRLGELATLHSWWDGTDSQNSRAPMSGFTEKGVLDIKAVQGATIGVDYTPHRSLPTVPRVSASVTGALRMIMKFAK